MSIQMLHRELREAVNALARNDASVQGVEKALDAFSAVASGLFGRPVTVMLIEGCQHNWEPEALHDFGDGIACSYTCSKCNKRFVNKTI